MKTKHTPGPWCTPPWDVTSQSVTSNDGLIASVYPCSVLNEAGSRIDPHVQERAANALLIAAAPDLLAALAALCERIDADGASPRDSTEYGDALAVIAKATGGEA